MIKLEFDVHSDYLGSNKEVTVILPNPHTWEGDREPMKVLYLLHGLGDDHTFWSRRTNIEDFVSDRNLMVVMPDGDVSWYCDMVHGKKYFSYLTEELPYFIKTMFNVSTKREDTFIGGASMGGYGAFKAGMTCPEKYGKVFTYSAAVDLTVLQQWIDHDLMENAMGPYEEAVKTNANSFILAEEAKASGKELPEVYIWCGTEDFLYQASINLRDKLTELGIKHQYHECPGTHEWPCWNGALPDTINWLLE